MGIFGRLAGKSDLDRVAAEVRAELRRRGIRDSWFDADAHAVQYRATAGAAPAWLGLDNLARKLSDIPRPDRAAAVAAHLDVVFEGEEGRPKAWPEVAPLLRLVFRDVTFGQSAHGPVVDLLSRPTLPLLRVFPVVDSPRSVAYVNRGMLAGWGVTEDDVYGAALGNLEAIAIAEGALGRSPVPATVTYRETGSEFFTSRLLLPGWIAAHAERVGGPPVVFAPDQNTLVVTTTATRGLAQVQADLMRRWGASENALSPEGYVLDASGALVPYRPAAEDVDALSTALAAERLHAARQYARQGELLKERVAQNGAAVQVASVTVVGRPGRRPVSTAIWSLGECLLPQVDEVVLMSGTDTICTVPWQVLAEEVSLQVAPDLDPVRYWMTSRPDPQTLERLRGRGVPDGPAR